MQSKLRETKTGYEAKREGSKIKNTEEIAQQKDPIMAKTQDKKFRQNPELKQKLMDLKGNLYEATRDDHFGTGLG